MIYSFEYDRSYSGPAFLTVELNLYPTKNRQNEISTIAWLDSGADATSVPISLITQLSARLVDRRFIRGVLGITAPVDMYEVWISIGSFNASRLTVIGDKEQERVILGRDLLNHYIVTLNGLAGVVEVSE